MNNLKLKRIASALLEGDEDPENEKAYFSETEFAASDINVKVEGIGTIPLPLTISCIEKLIAISSKAKFGLREQTIVDENVRNTHEIAAEKLHVIIEESAMTQTLNKIREELGLHNTSVLSPHLHNMLIYGRGHFFKLHQDTEKMNNMVATFVVVLPSAHIGGDLVIYQGEKKHVFSTENIDEQGVKSIAFYTDCLHEVEKLKDGFRVALTFNLVLDSKEAVSDQVNRRLKIAIQKYFSGDDNTQKPQKLVYFLNHEYSAQGLKWRLLKGSDRVNANSILNVAKSLHLVPYLALVEIHQTFEDEDDYYTQGSASPELYETNTTLSHWVDASSIKLQYDKITVNEDEICWTKDMESFEPYNTERSGYTGNAGCTKDYWYRRAAVVLWSESIQIAMNFSLGHKTALIDLHKLTRVPGNENLIMDTILKAGEYFYKDINKTENFIKCTDIAIYLHDPEAATKIFARFSRAIVTVSTAESLTKLMLEYGVDWCIAALKCWGSRTYNFEIDNVDLFIQTFMQNKGDAKIAELLLEQQTVIRDDAATTMRHLQPMRIDKRIEKLQQMFKACEVIQSVPILFKFIELVKANPKKYPFVELTDLFLKLEGEIGADFYAHFEPLKVYLLGAVDAELALGDHCDSDWSLEIDSRKINCNCELCSEAIRFLTSKTAVMKRWPLRQDLRKHLSFALRGFYLPIDITEEKTGSPHKLIVTKKPSIHADAKQRYQKVLRCQQELTAHKFWIQL
ncbi:hypothetical protein JTE90_007825 [Oedothorax gibbosus]|uniref:Prolyl 4-hydroxylase alpha subunit Fe(2+) 2OG dioxygenase domain-containing protein n=1 Tax=Oedothorax gibbosus TaxID=931172 RepID=A0AAV6VJ64_9ARAC|nr:hypothetical protein JTE90_007825 [Oedothorax gibbosus]